MVGKGGATEDALLSATATTLRRAATAAGGAGQRWPSSAMACIAPELPQGDDAGGFFIFMFGRQVTSWERRDYLFNAYKSSKLCRVALI